MGVCKVVQTSWTRQSNLCPKIALSLANIPSVLDGHQSEEDVLPASMAERLPRAMDGTCGQPHRQVRVTAAGSGWRARCSSAWGQPAEGPSSEGPRSRATVPSGWDRWGA